MEIVKSKKKRIYEEDVRETSFEDGQGKIIMALDQDISGDSTLGDPDLHLIMETKLIHSKIEEISSDTAPTDYDVSDKLRQIDKALDEKPVDIEVLKELARTEGGFISDENRRKTWPLLMDVKKTEDHLISMEEAKQLKDYDQVLMDVNRSLKRFPPGIEENNRHLLMDQLTLLILRVLHKHPELHYYQGYHDVAITFLLVMGENAAYELVEKLSKEHLKEFMNPTMERTVHYLTYVYPILKRVSPDVHDALARCSIGTMFCLPWLITWYAHTLTDYRDVVRLYDFFLASPFLMPIYFAVAIVQHKSPEILGEDHDMPSLHSILSKVPNSLPFEKLLQNASRLYEQFPPGDEIEQEVIEIINKNAAHEKILRQEGERRLKQRISRNRKPTGSRWRRYMSYVNVPTTWYPVLGIVLVGIVLEGLRQYYSPQSSPSNGFVTYKES